MSAATAGGPTRKRSIAPPPTNGSKNVRLRGKCSASFPATDRLLPAHLTAGAMSGVLTTRQGGPAGKSRINPRTRHVIPLSVKLDSRGQHFVAKGGHHLGSTSHKRYKDRPAGLARDQ